MVGLSTLGFTSATCSPDKIFIVGQMFIACSEGSTPWALTSHSVAEKPISINADGKIVGQVGESVTKISENIEMLFLSLDDNKEVKGTITTIQKIPKLHPSII